MKTILRIEHSIERTGMFKSSKGVYDISELNKLAERHDKFPRPREDKKIGRFIKPDEFCAFKSVSQLQEWVTKEEVRILHEYGFVVLMIDVNECIEGECQILYRKEDIINQKDVTLMFM